MHLAVFTGIFGSIGLERCGASARRWSGKNFVITAGAGPSTSAAHTKDNHVHRSAHINNRLKHESISTPYCHHNQFLIDRHPMHSLTHVHVARKLFDVNFEGGSGPAPEGPLGTTTQRLGGVVIMHAAGVGVQEYVHVLAMLL